MKQKKEKQYKKQRVLFCIPVFSFLYPKNWDAKNLAGYKKENLGYKKENPGCKKE